MKIGMIGCGNMGEAILAGIHKAYQVCVCEKDKKRALALKRKYSVQTCDLECVVQSCDVIILAVKPQGMDGLLKVLDKSLRRETLIISIAAGITTRYVERKLPARMSVVRTMPNMPAHISEGMTGISKGKYATQKDVMLARDIFGCVGKTIIVEEKMLDAVTAVSGSGPAYVFLFVECMIKAAKSLGFSDQVSKELVYQTLLGSVHQLVSVKEDAGVLRQKVTSKGGTTQAALGVFKEAKFEKTVKDALKAARQRSKELAK